MWFALHCSDPFRNEWVGRPHNAAFLFGMSTAHQLELPAVAEEWRDVASYEGRYEVSSEGKVWSLITKRVLQAAPTSRGYLSVLLYDGSSPKRPRSHCVHDLVAAAFHGPKPAGMNVDHVDGHKQNNRASNLEYVTRSENLRRAHRLGLAVNAKGAKAHNSKLTTEQVAEIRRRGETETRASLAREFGVDPITILNVIRKRTYAEI